MLEEDGTVTIRVTNIPDGAPLVAGGEDVIYDTTVFTFSVYTESGDLWEYDVLVTGSTAQWESPVVTGGDLVSVDVQVFTSSATFPDYWIDISADFIGTVDGDISFNFTPADFEIW